MATVHVIPVNDLKEHEDSSTCECQPRVDIVEGGMVVVHHAWDNREIVEQATAIIDRENSGQRRNNENDSSRGSAEVV